MISGTFSTAKTRSWSSEAVRDAFFNADNDADKAVANKARERSPSLLLVENRREEEAPNEGFWYAN